MARQSLKSIYLEVGENKTSFYMNLHEKRNKRTAIAIRELTQNKSVS